MPSKRKSKKQSFKYLRSILNSRTRLELLLIVVLSAALMATWERTAKVNLLTNELHPTNVAKPAETAVPPEKIAEKLDYSRKIVSVKPGQSAAFQKQVAALGGSVVDQITAGSFVVNLPSQNHEELTKALQASGTVENVETDYPAAISADRIDWGIDRISAPKVWGTTSGQNIRVAVLDTGVDESHTDLNGSVINRYNFINDTATAADGHGHGTHVAGTVAAAQNGSGMQGASYQAKILAGKVLADDGVGYLSDVVEGINWAVANGAKVVNLSLGSTYDSQLLEDTVNQAAARGVVVVAAAGNTGGPMLYPAAYSSVLSVGATDSNNELASFSARGATIVAPGVGITSTLPGNRYASWSGTSMAAPHVSGAAALLAAIGEPNIKDKLRDHATDLGDAGADYKYGYGLVNIETSMNSTDKLPPLVTILSPANDSTHAHGRLQLSASATDESGIDKVEFLLDGQVSNSFTAEPFNTTVSLNKLSEGSHTLLVRAVDKKGNLGQAQVIFTVSVKSGGNERKNQPKTGESVKVEQTDPPTSTNLEERSDQGAKQQKSNPGKKKSFLQNFLSALLSW